MEYSGQWESSYADGPIERIERSWIAAIARVEGHTLRIEGAWPEAGEDYLWRVELPLRGEQIQELSSLAQRAC